MLQGRDLFIYFASYVFQKDYFKKQNCLENKKSGG